MQISKQHYIFSVFAIFAAAYIILAIIGGVHGYSPVPFQDMWDDYVNFYTQLLNGNNSVWWHQANEHRILLARTLFYLDLTLFNGTGFFLVIIIYILAGLSFLGLFLYLNTILVGDENNFLRKIVGLVILILVFSWIQKENFTRGDGCLYIQAQLGPLMAFYLLHKAKVSGEHARLAFFFRMLVRYRCNRNIGKWCTSVAITYYVSSNFTNGMAPNRYFVPIIRLRHFYIFPQLYYTFLP